MRRDVGRAAIEPPAVQPRYALCAQDSIAISHLRSTSKSLSVYLPVRLASRPSAHAALDAFMENLSHGQSRRHGRGAEPTRRSTRRAGAYGGPSRSSTAVRGNAARALGWLGAKEPIEPLR